MFLACNFRFFFFGLTTIRPLLIKVLSFARSTLSPSEPLKDAANAITEKDKPKHKRCLSHVAAFSSLMSLLNVFTSPSITSMEIALFCLRTNPILVSQPATQRENQIELVGQAVILPED